jgi:hypothetical protein
VQIHIGANCGPVTVELVDLSESGVRFRLVGDGREARLAERARFTFMVPDQEPCTAEGTIVRVHDGGEFIVVLDWTNESFRGFVASLSCCS